MFDFERSPFEAANYRYMLAQLYLDIAIENSIEARSDSPPNMNNARKWKIIYFFVFFRLDFFASAFSASSLSSLTDSKYASSEFIID
jgi:hypothetical protein